MAIHVGRRLPARACPVPAEWTRPSFVEWCMSLSENRYPLFRDMHEKTRSSIRDTDQAPRTRSDDQVGRLQFGFTNRPTMPAEPLAREGEPCGTIFPVTSSLVRPGGRSLGSRSVAISTNV